MTLKTVKLSIVKGTEPKLNFQGNPLKRLDIPTNDCSIHYKMGVIQNHSAPRMRPIRLIYGPNSCLPPKWHVRCDVLCAGYFLYYHVTNCAFLHIYCMLHRYYVISQILNVWSIYLHLGSLWVSESYLFPHK